MNLRTAGPFYTVHEHRNTVQEYWGGLPFPSPVDNISSELSTMNRLSLVAHNHPSSVACSFTELRKPSGVKLASEVSLACLCAFTNVLAAQQIQYGNLLGKQKRKLYFRKFT